MLKKLLIALLAAAGMTAFGCWFTPENFEGCYIVGVNGTAHYTAGETFSDAVYHNGHSVAMPLTVYVKVSPYLSSGTSTAVTKAVLQYKILPSGNWVTVRTIDTPSWSMDFSVPVSLFGKNCIDLRNITSGTEILIRVYFKAGVYESGNLATDITSTIPDTATVSSGGRYEGGWTAPVVYRVIWNGKRRAK